VPSILDYARRSGTAPRALALGFAGFLAFQDGTLQGKRRAAGESVPADATGDRVRAYWSGVDDSLDGLTTFVRAVSADTELWGADLSTVPGFVEQVAEHLYTIRSRGAVAAIEALELPSLR
jgi:tagaturonate reductase